MSERFRHLIVLLLALTLVVAGAAQSVQATDMAVRMSATASTGDMPMAGGCSGCSGDEDGLPMACFAVCGNMMTAIVPTAPFVASAVLVSQTGTSLTPIVGHRGPPDPYPPKPTSLS